jgi:hypothetical protein
MEAYVAVLYTLLPAAVGNRFDASVRSDMRPFHTKPVTHLTAHIDPARRSSTFITRKRRLLHVLATADDKEDFDIDALASKLSSEASKLGREYRQSFVESESSRDEDDTPSTSASDRDEARRTPQRATGPFGVEVRFVL